MPSNQDPQNSGRFSRPIDAPSLPPWRQQAEDDETPTLSGDSFGADEPSHGDETQWVQVPKHPEPSGAGEDPRQLARRLAEEAKKRLGQTPPGSPEREDPRQLAKRLAEEAKQRHQQLAPQPLPAQTPVPPPPAEDPRALAKRLAEEAKQRLAQTPGPAPEVKRPTPKRRESYTPAPLAERAAARPLTAAEALAKAREAEQRAPATKKKKAKKAKAKPAPQATAAPTPQPPAAATKAAPPAAKAAPRAAPAPQPTPAPAASADPPGVVVSRLLPGAEVTEPAVVGNRDVFKALWRAHRARAMHEADMHLVATASSLLDAVERVPAGKLVAVRVTIAGATWAAWVDLEREAVLGLAQPADVYLAGS